MKHAVGGTLLVGAVIGALNLAHYSVTGRMDGVATPFGLFPGGFPVATMLGVSGRGSTPDLPAMIVLGLGILAGALISARSSGELTLERVRRKRLSGRKALRAAAGGGLMGAGTWMAQGCLIKHTLSGAPGLMLSSFVTLGGIVVGIWASAWLASRAT